MLVFYERRESFTFQARFYSCRNKVFENRLLSTVALMKIGDYWVDIQHLINIIKSKHKIEHNLIKCDVTPKDLQNFASCRRISSELVLNLLKKDENCKGTYVYLSLLRSVITGLIEKSTIIEESLQHIRTVVFTYRFWWAWLQKLKFKNNSNNSNSQLIKKN